MIIMKKLKNGFFKVVAATACLIFSSYSYSFEYEWADDKPELLTYVKGNKESIVKWASFAYENGKPYREYIETIAAQNGVPKEFYVLAAVESSYKTHATSSAGAKGMWQFMKGTAGDLGLRGGGFDNRTNWEKSTVAAVQYIKYLAEENFYGDYELAILAYNAGVGKVKRAILKNQSADVWVLIQDKETFRQESREYLPKFIAYANYFKYLDEQEK
jgi:membrane-bound lytic murein transglycosylase D